MPYLPTVPTIPSPHFHHHTSTTRQQSAQYTKPQRRPEHPIPSPSHPHPIRSSPSFLTHAHPRALRQCTYPFPVPSRLSRVYPVHTKYNTYMHTYIHTTPSVPAPLLLPLPVSPTSVSSPVFSPCSVPCNTTVTVASWSFPSFQPRPSSQALTRFIHLVRLVRLGDGKGDTMTDSLPDWSTHAAAHHIPSTTNQYPLPTPHPSSQASVTLPYLTSPASQPASQPARPIRSPPAPADRNTPSAHNSHTYSPLPTPPPSAPCARWLPHVSTRSTPDVTAPIAGILT